MESSRCETRLMPIQNSQTAIKFQKNVQFHMLIAFCYKLLWVVSELPEKTCYLSNMSSGKAPTMFINLTIDGLDTSKCLESFLR
jgi:hypothetical protein